MPRPAKIYGARALIPIDCAAISYQLVDLKTAVRRTGLRPAIAFNFGCELRAFPGRFAARPVLPFFRIVNLPALNRHSGDRRNLDPAPSRDHPPRSGPTGWCGPYTADSIADFVGSHKRRKGPLRYLHKYRLSASQRPSWSFCNPLVRHHFHEAVREPRPSRICAGPKA
jgi:hypothetical protein